MNKLNQDGIKELDTLIAEAQRHVFNGFYHWMGTEQEDSYVAWKTRAKALLGVALPSNSPDLIRIAEHQKPGCLDLEFPEYVGMLNGVKQNINVHQN